MRRDAGLTLLELTAALAIFSLIAVMGLQALSGSVRLQSRLTERDADTWAAARALTLLRHDLEAMAPLMFHDPSGDIFKPFAADAASGTFAISLAGQMILPETHETGTGRAEWRYDRLSTSLKRRYWPDLHPASTDVAGPETDVIDGVDDLSVRVLTDEGWQDSFEGEPPLAVEVVLSTRRHGILRVIVAP